MSKHSIENARKEIHGQDKNNHDQHKHQATKDQAQQDHYNNKLRKKQEEKNKK